MIDSEETIISWIYDEHGKEIGYERKGVLVRCKDCKKYMTIHCTCDGCCISDEWYCADGERKGQDHD
jgi:hypothetical protein